MKESLPSPKTFSFVLLQSIDADSVCLFNFYYGHALLVNFLILLCIEVFKDNPVRSLAGLGFQ